MIELPRYVFGIDPGYMSGLSIFDLLLEKEIGSEVPFDRYGFELERIISEYRPAVACEAFVVNARTAKNTQAPWSLEGIGIARYLARKYECPFETQLQSSAVGFAPDDRLKKFGWYVPGQRNLKRAQAQVLMFLVRHKWWHPLLDDEQPNTIVKTG